MKRLGNSAQLFKHIHCLKLDKTIIYIMLTKWTILVACFYAGNQSDLKAHHEVIDIHIKISWQTSFALFLIQTILSILNAPSSRLSGTIFKRFRCQKLRSMDWSRSKTRSTNILSNSGKCWQRLSCVLLFLLTDAWRVMAYKTHKKRHL